MESIEIVPVRELAYAVSRMLEAKALLALARHNLEIAQSNVKLVIDRLNELYRERRALRAEARFMRDTPVKDAGWEEESNILFSLADALEDEYWRVEGREYYRAYFRLWDCEKEVADRRLEARDAGKEVYKLVVAHREGRLVEDGLLDPLWDFCDCCYCVDHDYDYDFDDEFGYIDRIADAQEEAAWKAEEAVEEKSERADRKARTKKADQRRRSRRSKRRDVNWRRD